MMVLAHAQLRPAWIGSNMTNTYSAELSRVWW